MSAKGKHQNTNRSWAARQMILEKIGVNSGGPMKDRRSKRAKDSRKSWRNEDWGNE